MLSGPRATLKRAATNDVLPDDPPHHEAAARSDGPFVKHGGFRDDESIPLRPFEDELPNGTDSGASATARPGHLWEVASKAAG